MSLDIEILRDKLELQENDEVKIDLTTRSFETFGNDSFQTQIIVENTMIMRPDLLALEIGSSMDFTEILKTNFISNPFTLNTDDIILQRTSGGSKIVSPASTIQETETDIRNKYVNPEKAATPDKNIKRLSDKFKNLQELGKDTPDPSKSNLPPNFNEFGVGEVEVINNKVRFAPGVGRNASECSTEPISKAELISKVLKNKLNN